MIEKGIKLSGLTPSGLKAAGALEAALGKFDRFYIGAEFCENLLPPPGELLRTAAFFLEKGRKVCVLTPPVSEYGIKTLKSSFKLLARLGADGPELTINDFGALELALECGLRAKINAGRLLCGNIFVLKKNTLELTTPGALRFFSDRGMDRFEISATGKKLRANFSGASHTGFDPSKLNLTLYYPYLNLTTTRACLLGAPDIPPHESISSINCRRECAASSFEVKHPLIRENLIVRGNTIFLKFSKKFYSSEKSLNPLRINRLVYCPFP